MGGQMTPEGLAREWWRVLCIGGRSAVAQYGTAFTVWEDYGDTFCKAIEARAAYWSTHEAEAEYQEFRDTLDGL